MDTRYLRTPSPASVTESLTRRAAVARLATGGALATLFASDRLDYAAAQATPAVAAQQPNTFRLSGEEVDITYATTSFAGQPTLSYRGPAGEFEFSSDEIASGTSAALGQLVTVQLEVVHDAYTLELTLLLPEINLTGGNEATEFSTLAILTRQLTTIGGPNMVDGALRTYDVVTLDGTAELLYY